MTGVNGYTFTAEMLAWAQCAAEAGSGTGALGPVDGFGLRELEAAAQRAVRG